MAGLMAQTGSNSVLFARLQRTRRPGRRAEVWTGIKSGNRQIRASHAARSGGHRRGARCWWLPHGSRQAIWRKRATFGHVCPGGKRGLHHRLSHRPPRHGCDPYRFCRPDQRIRNLRISLSRTGRHKAAGANVDLAFQVTTGTGQRKPPGRHWNFRPLLHWRLGRGAGISGRCSAGLALFRSEEPTLQKRRAFRS